MLQSNFYHWPVGHNSIFDTFFELIACSLWTRKKDFFSLFPNHICRKTESNFYFSHFRTSNLRQHQMQKQGKMPNWTSDTQASMCQLWLQMSPIKKISLGKFFVEVSRVNSTFLCFFLSKPFSNSQHKSVCYSQKKIFISIFIQFINISFSWYLFSPFFLVMFALFLLLENTGSDFMFLIMIWGLFIEYVIRLWKLSKMQFSLNKVQVWRRSWGIMLLNDLESLEMNPKNLNYDVRFWDKNAWLILFDSVKFFVGEFEFLE